MFSEAEVPHVTMPYCKCDGITFTSVMLSMDFSTVILSNRARPLFVRFFVCMFQKRSMSMFNQFKF